MAGVAKRQRRWQEELESAEAEAAEAARISGVHRVAAVRAALEEERPSSRPTIRSPRWHGDLAPSPITGVYEHVLGGALRLRDSVPSTAALETLRLRTTATTKDLLIGMGSLGRIPFRRCSDAELTAAPIDNAMAFLLSLIDNRTSIESVIDASPFPMTQVLQLLTQLLALHLIGLRGV